MSPTVTIQLKPKLKFILIQHNSDVGKNIIWSTLITIYLA